MQTTLEGTNILFENGAVISVYDLKPEDVEKEVEAFAAWSMSKRRRNSMSKILNKFDAFRFMYSTPFINVLETRLPEEKLITTGK